MKLLNTVTKLGLVLALGMGLLVGSKKVMAAEGAEKVLFDKGVLTPGWEAATVGSVTKGSQQGGLEFTIETWTEGANMWPRLSFTGPGVDVSAYTNLVFEIENPADNDKSVFLTAQNDPDNKVALAYQLPPKKLSRIVLDISDGATIDQSNLKEIIFFLVQPDSPTRYIVRKVSAIKNPDLTSRRVALGAQLQETQRSLELVKKSGVASYIVGQMQAVLDKVAKTYEGSAPGYVAQVQKSLLGIQGDIARLGMESRGKDLWLWGVPLGVALRQGALPSPADAALEQIRETVCLNQYKAICVNISAAAQAQSLRLTLSGSGAGSGLLALRPTYFSKARDGSMTADAIGASVDQLDIEVPAYESQQVLLWVDTKKQGVRAGKQAAQLQIARSGSGELVKNLPVEITVADIRLASSLPISVGNWAYFYLHHTKVTDGLEPEAVANLRDYGVNTWCVNYSQVPVPQLDAAGKYAGLEKDSLAAFLKVMELLKGNPEEHFVIWLGFHREELKADLSKPGVLAAYLKDLRAILDRYQVAADKRYLMFWDEPKLPDYFDSIEWMNKVRAVDTSFKFMDNGSSLPTDRKGLADFVKLADRWFPNWEQFFQALPEDVKAVEALKPRSLGFYRCLVSRNNRGVNIYEYYRLVGWYAMQQGYDNLWFWVYNAGDEDPWDGTKGTMSGAVVVYRKDDKLLTSRRFELFREGLDDYKLGQAALGAKGSIDARKNKQLAEICQGVAANPNDAAFADRMRLKLIDMARQQKAKGRG